MSKAELAGAGLEGAELAGAELAERFINFLEKLTAVPGVGGAFTIPPGISKEAAVAIMEAAANSDDLQLGPYKIGYLGINGSTVSGCLTRSDLYYRSEE